MNDLKIEKIDPQLFKRKTDGHSIAASIRAMEVGDVFAFSGTSRASVVSTAWAFASHSVPARKYSSVILPDGRIAVKRIL